MIVLTGDRGAVVPENLPAIHAGPQGPDQLRPVLTLLEGDALALRVPGVRITLPLPVVELCEVVDYRVRGHHTPPILSMFIRSARAWRMASMSAVPLPTSPERRSTA